MRKVWFESKTQAAIYIIGAINVFWMVPFGSILLGGIKPSPLGVIYLVLFPASLLLWLGVAHKNKIAIIIQIIILATLIIISSFLTALVIMFGPIVLYDFLAPSGVPSAIISTILLSSYILPLIGFGPGFIVETAIAYVNFQNWLEYEILVTGPTTLVLSIIFLAITIVYWRSVKRGGLFE